MSDEGLNLSDVISLARKELQAAHDRDLDQDLTFDVQSVTLNVAIQVTRRRSGRAGLDLKVLGVGVSGEGGDEGTRGTESQISVVLTPNYQGTGRYSVSAADTEEPLSAGGE